MLYTGIVGMRGSITYGNTNTVRSFMTRVHPPPLIPPPLRPIESAGVASICFPLHGDTSPRSRGADSGCRRNLCSRESARCFYRKVYLPNQGPYINQSIIILRTGEHGGGGRDVGNSCALPSQSGIYRVPYLTRLAKHPCVPR